LFAGSDDIQYAADERLQDSIVANRRANWSPR